MASRAKGTKGSIVVFPGSFDPLTNGHVDVVERSLEIFDTVVIGVLDNVNKSALFSPQERVELIQRQFQRCRERVEVASFSGLLVDFVRKVKSRVVVRGLRAISDFDYEAQMALVNRRLNPGIETLFLMAREENSYISSTVVRQVALLGGDVGQMVPKVVEEALRRKFLQRSSKAS